MRNMHAQKMYIVAGGVFEKRTHPAFVFVLSLFFFLFVSKHVSTEINGFCVFCFHFLNSYSVYTFDLFFSNIVFFLFKFWLIIAFRPHSRVTSVNRLKVFSFSIRVHEMHLNKQIVWQLR